METELLNLNEGARTVLRIAQSLALEYRNATYSSGHLLRALLNKSVGIRDFIQGLGVELTYLEEWADVRIEDLPKGNSPDIREDAKAHNVIEEADNVRLKLGLLKVDPICILSAICRPNVGFSADQLKTFPIREKDIFNSLLCQSDGEDTTGSSAPVMYQSSADSTLSQYCTDKTLLAKEEKLYPVVRRDKELRMMIEVLGRHSRPNVIITGESGVGKTALVDGLACYVISGNAPGYLQDVTIFELDMGALIAGATYKGEVEDRLKNIIKELRSFDKAILFIDEIHLLLDSRSGSSGAGGILKQELSKGYLTVIGATTTSEYRKIIEPDHAFRRRFEEIALSEPDIDSAIAIVHEVYGRYTGYHGVEATDEALIACVQLAKRYIKDRKLPDAAIDLLDRTLASVKMINETAGPAVLRLQSELAEILSSGRTSLQDKLQPLRSLYFSIRNQLNPILLDLIPASAEDGIMDNAGELAAYLQKELDSIGEIVQRKITRIGSQEIASVIAGKTGIPVGKIQSGEKERLMKIEDLLRRRVVGQDTALKVLADAILESRSGMNKSGQPIGSFFLLGPTGTGKTELAKALAEVLFNEERAMIRFDMSEFKEEHSAATLYGAPPGYVGYEEGGLLVNRIRQQPYSVVLFDEIEKAHPSVYDIFLQIMDEGKLHDRLGKEGDFSNAIILFTSNVGSEWLAGQNIAGIHPSTFELMEVMGQYFRPEFLARLSEIVPFSPINEAMLLQIFNIQLQELIGLLEKKGIGIQLTEKASHLLANMDFTPKYGARQIAGTIRNQLRRPISRLLITGKITKGSSIHIDIDDNNKLIWTYEHI